MHPPRLRSVSRRLFTGAIWLVIIAGVLRTPVLARPAERGAPVADADRASPQAPRAIAIRPHASDLEWLAAQEVRRYVYLRTGTRLPVKAGAGGAGRVVVACKDRAFCGALGQELGPDQFLIESRATERGKTWWIVGGDGPGTLYGAYRFAEKLGVRFALDDDVLPEERLTGDWPDVHETARPRFALRGLQPFHDFSVGPDWWNLHDYQGVLSQMAKLRLNFIGFHTYPSWNPAAGPEANVWIGLPEDVDAQGNVKAAYEAGVVTTRRGWNVTPYPTGKYAAGASLLFEADDYGPDFMLECLEWPKTDEAAVALFNRYGDFQRQAFAHARRLGIRTCVGTEIPLGVPPMLAARLEARGLKANDPAVIRRLYEGTFLRLERKTPVDYYWLWTPEIGAMGAPGWEIVTEANFERDLGVVQAAARAARARFGLATCGWRLGTPTDRSWLHQRAPIAWVASAIGSDLGRAPLDAEYGKMPGRRKWAIGWAEDDGTAGAACCTCLDLQLYVERMFRDAADAARVGCEGMMAIHWRTAAIAPTIAALSEAGWEFAGVTDAAPLSSRPESRGDAAAVPNAMGAGVGLANRFWADWGRGMFGGDAGAEAGRLMQKLDGAHWAINGLYDPKTTDERIAEFFAPLEALESLRPRIRGVGNLERYDYWLDLIRATRARAQTWILAERRVAALAQAKAIAEPEARRQWARDHVLPLRLAAARRHEETIAAFVNSARSPGELGVIAHLEYGMRDGLVSKQDTALEELLGQPLPPEATVSTEYRGAPRIFVSARCTQRRAGTPQEIRAFVVSRARAVRVDLHWRPLGKGAFEPVAATHRARQAYRVTLPSQRRGIAEYYLEATLEDGQVVRWPATAPALNQTVVAW